MELSPNTPVADETSLPPDRIKTPDCLHRLFEQQVERTPDNLAVVHQTESLSYQALNQRANQWARYLQTLGVGINTPVALCVERSIETIVALLAILKAGGAYIPLDPLTPTERLRMMLEDGQAPVLLTQEALSTQFSAHPFGNIKVICLEQATALLVPFSGENLTDVHTPEQLAYIIHTSGSTGKPKGVCCTHRGVPTLLTDLQRCQPIVPGDACALWTALSFDVSVYEIFSALLYGGTLHLVPTEIRSDPLPLLRWLDETTINSAYLPPFILPALAEWQTQHPLWLKRLLVGVEPIPEKLLITLAQNSPGLQIINGYGPTEATIAVTLYAIETTPEALERLEQRQSLPNTPIGKGIASASLFLLDENQQPVGKGETGELYIGGPCLAQGYWNRPDLTQEKFIPNPVAPTPHRLYRTGDRVKQLPDGNYYFLGRIDHQIKWHGVRIEPGEIEQTLCQIPPISEALVMVREIFPEGKEAAGNASAQLVAYMRVPVDIVNEPSAFLTHLRTVLRERLPATMIPTAFVPLTGFPQTPNGKVDRRALPLPHFFGGSQSSPESHATAIETQLVSLWKSLLPVSTIGIHDNFFNLGGHSLSAIQLIIRIREAFHVELSHITVFKSPTIAALATVIENSLNHSINPSEKAQIIDSTAPTAAPISVPYHLPLAIKQEGIWLFEQLHANSPTYHIPLAFKLTGTLRLAALEQTLTCLVARHTALRTNFLLDIDGNPIQRIQAPYTCHLLVRDLSSLPQTVGVAEMTHLLQEEISRPFNLAVDRLWRAALIRLQPDENILILTFHHLICDGWSIGLILNELSHTYGALVTKEPTPFPNPPPQYSDYCRWETHWLTHGEAEKEKNYWKEQLRPPLGNIELPSDAPRPPVQTFHGARQPINIAPHLTQALRTLCQHQEVTLFILLLAAFKILLYRYTGQTDLLVGTAVAARTQLPWEKTIGLLINTLVLRTDASHNPPFTQYLQQVRTVTLAAYTHQTVPYSTVLTALAPDRDLSHKPLIQSFFLLQNFEMTPLTLPGLQITPLPVSTGTAKFDLTLELYEKSGGLQGWIEYNTDLFAVKSIQRLVGHFQTLLESIVARPDTKIDGMGILTKAERQQLQSRTPRLRPARIIKRFEKNEEQGIVSRFEQQVALYPQRLAVKTARYAWKYEDLNWRANQLARRLLSVLPASTADNAPRVGLLFEHDAPMLIGLWGVLKAGLIYVPLDPGFPPERLLSILQDAKASVLVSQRVSGLEALAQGLSVQAGVPCVWVEDDENVGLSSDNLNVSIAPSQVAYLLYTSGSTGKPKAVIQSHRNVLHFIRSYSNNLYVNADDRLSLFSSYCFDAAVMDIFASLLNGATLYPFDLKQAESQLPQWLFDQGITIFHSTPTVYRYLLSELTGMEVFPQLRLIVLGGEAVYKRDLELYKKFFSHGCLFVNGLGPTESTVTLQYFANHFSKQSQNAVPVGYPVEETEVFLVNEQGEEKELYGEIAIRSRYVALGYWQRPDLTEKAFRVDAQFPDKRIYRTGDLGFLRPEGVLEFVGRKDSQVKIRGFRIELGEIENVLNQHPAVHAVTVVGREDTVYNKRLVAYVVPTVDKTVVPAELLAFCKEKLPDYMVPSDVVVLSALPLLANGKVNVAALPVPESHKELFVPPTSETEQLLARLWEKALNTQPIGVHDNFFSLGGNSLLAIHVIHRIEKQFGKQLPLMTLFQSPTIAELAAVLSAKTLPSTGRALEVVQAGGRRLPFFFIGSTVLVRALVSLLGADQPLYGLNFLGLESSSEGLPDVKQVAQFYVREIQSVQPQGPYCLGGFCGDAVLALEVAKQLQSLGQEVAFLAAIEGFIDVAWQQHQSGFFELPLQHHWLNFVESGFPYLWYKVRQRLDKMKKRLHHQILEVFGSVYYRRRKRPLPRSIRNLLRIDALYRSLGVYRVHPFSGHLTLFLAAEWRLKNAPQFSQLATEGVEIYEIPGYHDNLFVSPQVEVLARYLHQCLDEVNRKAQGPVG